MSMSKALESPALSTYYKEYVDGSTAFFIGMFEKIQKAGESDVQNPEASGISLMGALDRIVSYAIVHPDIDVETLANQMEAIWF